MTKQMEHGQFTGWHSISSEGPYSTIPGPFIQDVSLIIEQMTTKGEIKKLYDCIALLEYHVAEDTCPHNLTIVEFTAQLLEQLYLKYRETGYLSDKEEMFRRLFYQLDIATWADIYSKTESTKALTVPGYRYLTNEHENSFTCHGGVFTEFMDKTICVYPPVISLRYNFPNKRLVEEVVENQIILRYDFREEWCDSHGTLMVGMYFEATTEDQTYLRLIGDNQLFKINITPESNLEFIYIVNNIPNVIISSPLHVTNGNIKFVFSYDTKKLYFKSMFEGDLCTVDFENFELNANKMELYKPMARNTVGGSIRDIWYYTQTVSDSLVLTSIIN